jgi:hypothetical protein
VDMLSSPPGVGDYHDSFLPLFPYRVTSLAQKGDRLILECTTERSCPYLPTQRGGATYATSGECTSSRDALLADSDLDLIIQQSCRVCGEHSKFTFDWHTQSRPGAGALPSDGKRANGVG